MNTSFYALKGYAHGLPEFSWDICIGLFFLQTIGLRVPMAYTGTGIPRMGRGWVHRHSCLAVHFFNFLHFFLFAVGQQFVFRSPFVLPIGQSAWYNVFPSQRQARLFRGLP